MLFKRVFYWGTKEKYPKKESLKSSYTVQYDAKKQLLQERTQFEIEAVRVKYRYRGGRNTVSEAGIRLWFLQKELRITCLYSSYSG